VGLFKRGSGGAKLGKLSALARVQGPIEGELGLRTTGVAGICFKPRPAKDFMQAEQQLDDLIGTVGINSSASVRRRSDSFGYEWLVVREGDMERLVAAVEMVAGELAKRGFGGQLLAALFRFDSGERPVFLVYGFKTGTFWPFVPAGEGQERVNDEEIRLRDALKSQIPIEPRLEQWLGLFDPPIED
jgi:hypothetical protein